MRVQGLAGEKPAARNRSEALNSKKPGQFTEAPCSDTAAAFVAAPAKISPTVPTQIGFPAERTGKVDGESIIVETMRPSGGKGKQRLG